MEEAVTRQHAHPNTVYHCLYAYYKLGYKKKHLAHIFNKAERTIRNWIKVYETTKTFQRANNGSKRQYTSDQRQWLLDYYHDHPLAYLDEAQDAFVQVHSTNISKTTVWRIIHEGGLTWKVLERRALATQTAAYPETATEHHLSRMVGCQYSALEAEDVRTR
ncbi:hypothetical protein F443_07621 [Phytophthora nicotianae P1569]|uniref:Transposase Tc1-like domain-containing protein n=1 Tax=Phytophthora nicotianae P1569 TaxID=1317065 RepID=V9FC26_PHYNI|nr:hypothetical protein F443_07621 [Phytophthora nicotianae P1569]